MDHCNFKLDGTEDEDDEVAQSKLLLQLAQDVKTGSCVCNLSARKRCEDVCHVVDRVLDASTLYCNVMEAIDRRAQNFDFCWHMCRIGFA